ncbi:MAG: YabP/YqfC family sporulation protein [Ruminococcus sp.]|nr:YabP/YqfC family sporulation protein [Ruminococcus sp.]
MKKSDKNRKIPVELTYSLPIIEFTGDRSVIVEGSTGVLKYESELVSINTRSMVIAFYGRGLTLKCISPTAVIIDGCITKTEFIR